MLTCVIVRARLLSLSPIHDFDVWVCLVQEPSSFHPPAALHCSNKWNKGAQEANGRSSLHDLPKPKSRVLTAIGGLKDMAKEDPRGA